MLSLSLAVLEFHLASIELGFSFGRLSVSVALWRSRLRVYCCFLVVSGSGESKFVATCGVRVAVAWGFLSTKDKLKRIHQHRFLTVD